MARLFLFDSGSTKTTLLVMDQVGVHDQIDIGVRELMLSGFNPNRPSGSFFDDLKKLAITAEDTVFFYGSGLGTDTNKQTLAKMLTDLGVLNFLIEDDITGASRALYGYSEGLVAIMGTGGCAAWYDGENVIDRRGGYGYLIDDIGGGYELGKRIISAWLNGDLPVTLGKAIQRHFNMDRATFTAAYYKVVKTKPQEMLAKTAGVVRLIEEYLDSPVIVSLVENYLETFFLIHVVPMQKKYAAKELRIVGSLGEGLKAIIHAVAACHGIELTKTLKYPALSLLEYHQKN